MPSSRRSWRFTISSTIMPTTALRLSKCTSMGGASFARQRERPTRKIGPFFFSRSASELTTDKPTLGRLLFPAALRHDLETHMQSQQVLARGLKSRPSRVNPDEIDELLALGSKPNRQEKAIEAPEIPAPPCAPTYCFFRLQSLPIWCSIWLG